MSDHNRNISSGAANVRRRNFLKLAGASAVGVSAGPVLGATNARAQAAGEPIRIGGALPISGWAAADGIEFRRGLEMGAEDINALGGVLGRPLQVVVEDTGDQGPSLTIQAMQRLVDRHNVHAIVNGYNAGSQAAEHDVVADSGIVFLNTNASKAHDELVASDPDRYFGCFQACPHEEWYGPGLLVFLNGLHESGQYTFKEKTIAVIGSPIDYSTRIANAIQRDAEALGWAITMFDNVTVPISEWGPMIAQIRQNPPAVIAITHFAPQDLARFMIQFAQNPTQSLVYMQYGPSLSAFREVGGVAVNGTLYSTTAAALPDEMGNEFGRRYKEKFGADASHLVGAQTYDELHIWATAAALAGGAGQPGDFEQSHKIAERIRRLIYRGVQGSYRITGEGQSAQPYPAATTDPSLGLPHQFLQITDHLKEPVMISPPPYAQASFVTPPWIKS